MKTKPVNKFVNKRKNYRFKAAIHTVMGTCPQLINKVDNLPRHLPWLRAWHKLGRKDRKSRPSGAARHKHDRAFTPLGHLTILAYQLGNAGAAWSRTWSALQRKNNAALLHTPTVAKNH
jgi:hypothetical protein